VGADSNELIRNFASFLSTLDKDGRQRVISRAEMLALKETSAEDLAPPIRTLGEYLEADIEIPPELVKPTILVRGEITATIGRAGIGKTTFNLNRLMKWAAGSPLFDDWTDAEDNPYLAPTKPLKTLIIENEGAAGMFHRRMGIMLTREGYLSEDERERVKENLLVWGNGGYSGLKLDDAAKVNLIRAGLEKWQPDVLFIEPFRGLWQGDENSSTDMANVVGVLQELGAEYGVATILSHHEVKGGGDQAGGQELMSKARGSTVLEGVVALMENFQKAKGGDYREIAWSKARYLEPPPTTRLECMKLDQWYKHVPDSNLKDDILRRLGFMEEATAAELAEALDEPVQKLYRPLSQLSDPDKDGRVVIMPSDDNRRAQRYRLSNGNKEEMF
jgi:RecA-family ATPase